MGVRKTAAFLVALFIAVSFTHPAAAPAVRWREDNRAALESSNAHVEAEGLPLTKFRQF